MPHTTFVATVFLVIPHSHTSMWPLHCVFRAVMPENLHTDTRVYHHASFSLFLLYISLGALLRTFLTFEQFRHSKL